MIRIRVLQGTCFLLSHDRMEQVQSMFRESFPSMASYADEIPSLLRDPVHHGYRTALLVAEGALGRVDAFALVLYFPDIRVAFLDFIATRPGNRSRGLGGALYESVRDFTRTAGARGLYMEVQPDDPEVSEDKEELDEARRRIAFYERYGVRVIDNKAYSRPVGDPPTHALLLFDGLDRGEPLPRAEAQDAVTRIVTQRFAHVIDPAYLREVISGFNEDPVAMQPLRGRTRTSLEAARPAPRMADTFSLVLTPKHELHHVKERGYFERPVRVTAIRESLEPTGLFSLVKCREHGEKPILAVHDRQFVHFLRTVCTNLKSERPIYPDTFPLRQADRRPKEVAVQAGYYCIDDGTPLYPNAYHAARSSVDAALTGADELLSGKRLAYSVCRPPGHHAGTRFYGGFCYFNNAAIAAQYLSAEARVAVLDIDFHHGNGTQDIFYRRDDVLTLSIHGTPDYAYPYFTGYAEETGEGAGLGFNLNLPLPPQSDEKRFANALKRALERVAEFKAEALIVGLGYDIMKGDPTGTFRLGPGAMRTIGSRLMELNLPLLVIQEGGYNLRNLRSGSREFFIGCAGGK